MTDIAIILAFEGFGSVLAYLGVPLPANVLGLLLMAAALFSRRLSLTRVEVGADFLLRYLQLLFLPLLVAVVPDAGLLGRGLWPVIASLWLGTAASIVVAAWVTTRVSGTDAESAAS
jgi:holin-like protein